LKQSEASYLTSWQRGSCHGYRQPLRQNLKTGSTQAWYGNTNTKKLLPLLTTGAPEHEIQSVLLVRMFRKGGLACWRGERCFL